ncbi:MAG TPA: hypothetical protein VF796_30390 [Humisphaera sp.]
MQTKKIAAALFVGAAMLVSRVSFAADAKPAAEKTKPAEAKPAEAKPGEAKPAEAKPAATSDVKLTKPWSDLTSLTAEQKEKISAVHKKALAETNAIEKKEKEDIMALLTDAQKTELKELADKKKKETATKKAAEKAAEKK